MKKTIISAILAVALVAVLTGCATPQTSTAGAVKTGLGQVVSIEKSTDATADADGFAQVDTIMAAVSVDASGKIVSVSIDFAQTKVNFSADGKITSDKTAAQQTKRELGDAYGMKSASSIGKEWYQEIDALEQWMVGKTIDEVKAMKTVKKDDAHPSVPDEADLKSSVTLSVEGFIAAVEEAVKNAK